MTEPFDFESFPRRLNLGCGFDRREGYLNVDIQAFHEPDLVADDTSLTMLPDDYYEEIQAIDVLEHLPRTSTEAVLHGWHRRLLPHGILSLRVPSLEGLSALFQQSESFDRHLELMQCLFGTQAYTGDFHLTSFTKTLLTTYLERAGFSVLSLRVRDEWLFEVVASAQKTTASRASNGRVVPGLRWDGDDRDGDDRDGKRLGGEGLGGEGLGGEGLGGEGLGGEGLGGEGFGGEVLDEEARGGEALEDGELDVLLARCITAGIGDHQFLDAVYSILLGREPDPEGEAFYLRGLTTDAFDRDAVVRSPHESDEHATARQLKRLAV